MRGESGSAPERQLHGSAPDVPLLHVKVKAGVLCGPDGGQMLAGLSAPYGLLSSGGLFTAQLM